MHKASVDGALELNLSKVNILPKSIDFLGIPIALNEMEGIVLKWLEMD